jgi:hypothetical protein
MQPASHPPRRRAVIGYVSELSGTSTRYACGFRPEAVPVEDAGGLSATAGNASTARSRPWRSLGQDGSKRPRGTLGRASRSAYATGVASRVPGVCSASTCTMGCPRARGRSGSQTGTGLDTLQGYRDASCNSATTQPRQPGSRDAQTSSRLRAVAVTWPKLLFAAAGQATAAVPHTAPPEGRQDQMKPCLTRGFTWWQVLGSNQRRLSRRFYRPSAETY